MSEENVEHHGAVSHQLLLCEICNAFAVDSAAVPEITLRGGNAVDDYSAPPPFDPSVDAITDKYLETYHWGVGYLDPMSWRHYLPSLMAYAFRHLDESSLVVEALLNSLRPPDHEPGRLASLTAEQEALVARFLDVLAFNEVSAHQELACQVLEEWWVPGALYRGMLV